jgi:precorrin-6B methylase 2
MAKPSHPVRALFVAALCFVIPALTLVAQSPGPSIETSKIFAALGLKPGQTIGEIGAGSGELSIEAAKTVGAQGKVFTSELGDDRVQSLERAAKASGLSQITVVTGDPNKTNFPEGCCDAIFMRNVYHHFADPAAMDASIFQSLKPGGRVGVIDFVPNRGHEAATPAERAKNETHGVSAESVAKELKGAGFEIASTDPGNDRWFMVVGMKPR